MTIDVHSLPRFRLGQIAITLEAKESLDGSEVEEALARHASGDWGDLSDAEKADNDESLKKGDQVVSVYHSRRIGGIKYCVITLGNRSETLIRIADQD